VDFYETSVDGERWATEENPRIWGSVHAKSSLGRWICR